VSRPFSWGEPPTAAQLPTTIQRDDRQRPLPSAQCSLCGIALPTGLLVPDGGQACADIRWYCKDAKSCTERWTANLPRHPHIAPTSANLAPGPGREREALPPAPERRPGPEPVPVREAWSSGPS
jgi:hypothetical protein